MNLTEQQKKELDQLRRTVMKRHFFIGVKSALMLIFMNITAVVINAVTVNSKDFVFLMSIISAILVVTDLMKWQKEERVKIEEAVRKILEK